MPRYAYAEDDYVIAWSLPPEYSSLSANLDASFTTEAGGFAQSWFDRELGDPSAIFRERDGRMFQHAEFVDGSMKIHAKRLRAAARGVPAQSLQDADFPAFARAWRDGDDVLLDTFDVTEDGGAGILDSAMFQRVLRRVPGDAGGLNIVHMEAFARDNTGPISGPWLRSLFGPTFHQRAPRRAAAQLWIADAGLELAPGVHVHSITSSRHPGYIAGRDPTLPEHMSMALVTSWFSVIKARVTEDDLYKADASPDSGVRQAALADDHPALRWLREVGPGAAVETHHPTKMAAPPTEEQIREMAAAREEAEREGWEYVEDDWTIPRHPAHMKRVATAELSSRITVKIGMTIENTAVVDIEARWSAACQALAVFRR